MEITPSKDIIYVDMKNHDKLVEYGKLIQAGTVKLHGYSSGRLIYIKL